MKAPCVDLRGALMHASMTGGALALRGGYIVGILHFTVFFKFRLISGLARLAKWRNAMRKGFTINGSVPGLGKHP
jgi:hypothetical protein